MGIRNFWNSDTQDLTPFRSTTGSVGIETTIKRTGNASYRMAAAATQASLIVGDNPTTAFAQAELYTRVACYIHVTTPPSTNFVTGGIIFDDAVGPYGQFVWFWKTDGTVWGRATYNNGSDIQVQSDVALPLDTWFVIEIRYKKSATVGILEVRKDGTVVATGSNLNTGTVNIVNHYYYGPSNANSLAATVYYADGSISDSAYPGTGQSILRKGKSGTPNYNAWTKQGGGTIDAEWLDIPFSATNNARSSAASQAQTILAADAAAGTNPVGASDTINACKIAAIIKRLTTTPSPTTQTRNPTSDVSFTGTWTGTAGSRFQNVDDYPDAGNPITDGLTCSANGEGLFGFSAFTVPAGATSISVQVLYHDFKNGSQGSAIGARIRCNDTTGRDASTHNPGNGNANIASRSDNYATNPKSGAAWTVNDVNGVGTNGLTAFGWNSSDSSPSNTVSGIQLQVTYTPAVADGTYKLRRRLNGSDTDTAKTLTTTDAWYDDGIWTDTLAHLSSMEFGGFRDSGGDHNVQIEDIWLLVDYTPVVAITVTVNQVTETDLAQRLGVIANRTNETDLAQAIAEQKARAIAQISEADSVTAVGRAKARTLPQLNETDTVTVVTRVKARLLGQASEVDTADVITPQLVTGSHTVTVNQVTETDTVTVVAWNPKNRAAGQALEADVAQLVVRVKRIVVQESSELNLAQPVQLLFHKLIFLGQIAELDLAQLISVSGVTPVAPFRAGRVPIRYTTNSAGVVPVRIAAPGAGVVPVVVVTVDEAGVVPCIITPDAAGVVPIVEEP